jgi:hypothetical protein
MDLDNNDYQENNDVVDMDCEAGDYMEMAIDEDEDLYKSPPQSPPTPRTSLSPEDISFLEHLTVSYFLKPKRKTLLQKSISKSQSLLIQKLNAEGISLQRWEEYFWVHRFSAMDRNTDCT